MTTNQPLTGRIRIGHNDRGEHGTLAELLRNRLRRRVCLPVGLSEL